MDDTRKSHQLKEGAFVTVPRTHYEFIRLMAFGKLDDPLATASRKAYHDLQRTIHYSGAEQEIRNDLRMEIEIIVKRDFPYVFAQNGVTQVEYDKWHEALCMKIVSIYLQKGFEFHLGQAQKWVNMMMKYLYVIQIPEIERIIPVLHVPIDNYIYQQAEEELRVPRINCCWSKIDSYELYLNYQNAIRKAVETAPILWEFEAWQRATSNR